MHNKTVATRMGHLSPMILFQSELYHYSKLFLWYQVRWKSTTSIPLVAMVKILSLFFFHDILERHFWRIKWMRHENEVSLPLYFFLSEVWKKKWETGQSGSSFLWNLWPSPDSIKKYSIVNGHLINKMN